MFATAGVGYIRVWHLATCRELLRITVPNLECHCIAFMPVRRAWRWRVCGCGRCTCGHAPGLVWEGVRFWGTLEPGPALVVATWVCTSLI